MTHRMLEARLAKLEQVYRSPSKIQKRRLPEWLDPASPSRGIDWSYDALPAQRVFHGDLTTRFKGYSGPIGSGKSHALAYEALFLSRQNPGLVGLIGAPTYTMSADATQRTLFEVLATENIPYIFNKQDNRLRFPSNGSEIIFRSMDNPERLRGPNLAWFGLDELTYTHEDAWTRMLGRLRHPEARRLCGFAVWTPKGYDWVYRQFVENKNPDYRLVQASPGENTHLPSDFYDRLKSSYNELFFRQEVLGQYLDIFGGNAYHAFSEANVKAVNYIPDLPICWTNDFNVIPLSSLICQIVPPLKNRIYDKPYINVIDEISLTDAVTEEACKEFEKRMDVLNEESLTVKVKVFGDASGSTPHTNARATDYKTIQEFFRNRSSYQLELNPNKSNPDVVDRINEVNHMLRSAAGEHRVFIDPKCKNLIRDLKQVAWAQDSWGNRVRAQSKTNPDLTHMGDALGYLIWKQFHGLASVGPREGTIT